MTEILVGRQPIFDRKQKLVGYELLYRSVIKETGPFDGDLATNKVIINTFMEIGLKNLVGNNPAFINFTSSFLTGKLPIPFPPKKGVLEIVEDVQINPALINACQVLSNLGYTIALDDVTSFEKVEPLLSVVNIVKIDLPYVNFIELPELIRRFKENHVTVLVEKVESFHEFTMCRSIGADLFQGFFLCQPDIIRGNKIDSNRVIILESLALLQDPQVDFHQIEKIVQLDVSLSYKLLKLVNSAYYSHRTTIKSISQAVTLIGIRQLSGWLTLLLITATPGKPHELSTISLTRAKMCEMLSHFSGDQDSTSYFLLGLFSILDVLFDRKMDDILSSIPVAQDIARALIQHEGKMGKILETVFAIEKADWNRVVDCGVNADKISDAYLKSMEWAMMIMEAIEDPV